MTSEGPIGILPYLLCTMGDKEGDFLKNRQESNVLTFFIKKFKQIQVRHFKHYLHLLLSIFLFPETLFSIQKANKIPPVDIKKYSLTLSMRNVPIYHCGDRKTISSIFRLNIKYFFSKWTYSA
jgi:hypothetical protein